MDKDVYDGRVCYVGHDHDAADGHPLKAGWHYSIAEGPDGEDMPDHPLYLDEKSGKYRLAGEDDLSWHERNHKRLMIVAVEGYPGEPRTDEEFEATYRHLDEIEKRIVSGKLLNHERNHVISKKEHVSTMRYWLKKSQGINE